MLENAYVQIIIFNITFLPIDIIFCYFCFQLQLVFNIIFILVSGETNGQTFMIYEMISSIGLAPIWYYS